MGEAPAGVRECAGCSKKIHSQFFLFAVDQYWHEDCLKCGCCNCRPGEVGQSLYTKGNLLLCKRDYLRLFGSTGYCAACRKVIPAFEMVMRARANVTTSSVLPANNVDTGSASVTTSTFTTTRCCVDPTTRSGWFLPLSLPTQLNLLNSDMVLE